VAEFVSASIVIPTRGRAEYLQTALASVAPQATSARAELIVVNDGADIRTAEVAQRYGASVISLRPPQGANAARNAGIGAARAGLVVFIDDDIAAQPGWLEAMLEGAATSPDYEVFGGPIRARLEGGGPRACGREGAPITTLDLGASDRDATVVWSANMAVRRSAFEHIGLFDEEIHGRGEEEDWEQRYKDAGGRIRYVSGAGVEHRRTAPDARLRALARASYRLGRTARRHDTRKGVAPSLGGELRTLAGCAWHAARRRCANGIVMGAQAAGRVHESLVERRS
jgi:glycosyltransferase involved in cell wall biosynthesis